MAEPRRIIVYKDETHTPSDLIDGERVALVRGDGPREGEVMWWATAILDNEGGLTLEPEEADASV